MGESFQFKENAKEIQIKRESLGQIWEDPEFKSQYGPFCVTVFYLGGRRYEYEGCIAGTNLPVRFVKKVLLAKVPLFELSKWYGCLKRVAVTSQLYVGVV